MRFYDGIRPGRSGLCLRFPRPTAALPPAVAMTPTLDDVARLAQLARLEIDAESARDVHAKLAAIFALIDELQAIDTAGIEPMSHAQDVSLPLRDDVVTETDRRAEFQRVAPAVEDGLYLVPRVIE
jgi:aspartyl-tRNA(Asn)/glutamyl-tRNA(Gln) amidotransferase subunit C